MKSVTSSSVSSGPIAIPGSPARPNPSRQSSRDSLESLEDGEDGTTSVLTLSPQLIDKVSTLRNEYYRQIYVAREIQYADQILVRK